jgi:peroxiredoxin
MKKLIIFFAGLLIITACDSGKQYSLSGHIEGASDVSIYLQQRIDKAYVSIDSVTSPDGTFEFSGSVDIPDVYYISLTGGRGKAMVFLENSDISLQAHKDSMFKPQVSGSDVHDEYLDFQSRLEVVYDKYDALYKEYREASQVGDTAIASELKDQMDELYRSEGVIQMDYLDAHPGSYISPFIAQSLHYGKEVDEIEELLAKLDPSLSATTIVGNIKRRVEVLKAVAVGKMAPDFTQNDTEGNPVSLSSFRGKYLLVDFWASWCGPCRRENPHVVDAYREFHERGLEILGVSLDDSREEWLKAIEEDKLTWTNVSELSSWSNSAAGLYGINSIPSNLLLDPEGKIIAKNLRGENLHKELSKHLAP